MTEDNSHAGQGSVMLDLGGDVGAIVVSMPVGMEAFEIEIRPAGESHQAVFGTNGHDEPDGPSSEPAHGPDAHDHGHDGGHGHAHEDDHAHADDHAHDGGHAHVHDHDHDSGHVHPWPHVGVVSRPAGGRLLPSAVFGEVVQGRYDLYVRPHGPVRLTVDVVGGQVTEAVWPA